jgi:hypothetical protein
MSIEHELSRLTAAVVELSAILEARIAPATAPTPATTPAPTPPTPPPDPAPIPLPVSERSARRALTVPALRERCLAFARTGRTQQILDLLRRFGATHLDNLLPKHYEDFELELLVLESEPVS